MCTKYALHTYIPKTSIYSSIINLQHFNKHYFYVFLQAAVGLEGMADGAVLSGIPRQMALKFSAHAVMVSSSYIVCEQY